MDGSAFDTLTRTLVTSGSRRHALGRGVATALGMLGLAADHAAAKKKPCPPCKKRKKGKCKGALPDGVACAGGMCQGGTCVAATPPTSCPSGQRPCRGSCLSVLICCDDGDCAGGRTCQQGTCACPATKPHICAGSTVCRECCTKAHCTPYTYQGSPVCSADGHCTCPFASQTYCAASRNCGECCVNSDCSGGMRCEEDGNVPLACTCPLSLDGSCQDSGGNYYCVPEECTSWCEKSCSTPGAVCCGNLVCQAEAPGVNRCYPTF